MFKKIYTDKCKLITQFHALSFLCNFENIIQAEQDLFSCYVGNVYAKLIIYVVVKKCVKKLGNPRWRPRNVG